SSVLQKALREQGSFLRRKGLGAIKQIVGPNPVYGPEGHFHGAVPVYSEIRRIALFPVLQLRNQLPCISLFLRQKKDLPACQEMVKPAELPGNLDVRRILQVNLRDILKINGTPPATAFEILMPVDVFPEANGPGT